MSEILSEGIFEHLHRFIGRTVTIFTTSGGESGSGFTGVILSINPAFVRLITRIGPAPGCALGNACSGFRAGFGPGGAFRPNSCGEFFPIKTVGSVTEIPIDRIAAFVHDAI